MAKPTPVYVGCKRCRTCEKVKGLNQFKRGNVCNGCTDAVPVAPRAPVADPPVRRRRKDSIALEAAFRARVAELGGRVVGEYVSALTPIECVCREGHVWWSPPRRAKKAERDFCGMCAKQSADRARPAAAELAFRSRVAELGGIVVEPNWLGALSPHRVVCPEGHPCRPTPANVQQGRGMCRACSGLDPFTAETVFRGRVAELGGEVVGEYVNSVTRIACRCPQGHLCTPLPTLVTQGKGMCRVCARNDPVSAEAAFRKRVAELGGTVLGVYAGKEIPVECICSQGHVCKPNPGDVQQGAGICRACAGKTWDVVYVVTNPKLGRLKFGITSGDERPRLKNHRRAGYANVIRVLSGIPDAHKLEQHIIATLRDAGVPAVHGREYFDANVLATVLDVVDGWAAA